MNEKQRYCWLDIIKIIACFLVIVNHSHGLLFHMAGKTTGTVVFDAFFFTICKIAVPLFIMTTGYLTLQKEVPYKKTFLRILRILVPLLAVSVFFYFQANGRNGSILNFIKQSVANPQNVSLWYLYMLLGLYLVIPFITKMVQQASFRDLTVFLVCFLVAPPTVQLLCKVFHCSVSTYLFSSFFTIAVCYLVAGFYVPKLPLRRSLFLASIGLFLAAEIPVMLLIVRTFKTTGTVTYAFDSWSSLPVIVASVSFFYIVRFLFEKISVQKTAGKVLREISATTFGVYLIHMIAINSWMDVPIVQSLFQVNAFMGILVYQIAIFVICAAIIFLLRRIPFVKWFL
ncbi:MAG: acyltransferase family protein [Clostridia bacterium]|nr:acyltransferase family protein [Clostridia bacterium]